jgi:uncharacterized glyoxalase superfamily protein PhnB
VGFKSYSVIRTDLSVCLQIGVETDESVILQQVFTHAPRINSWVENDNFGSKLSQIKDQIGIIWVLLSHANQSKSMFLFLARNEQF